MVRLIGNDRIARMALFALAVMFAGAPSARAEGPARPNVLFIAVDDLNHWVGHLGRNPQTKTPNLDRLAQRGVTFTRAYCAAPVCNPSRAAVMSGLRPSTTGVYDNGQDWRPVIPKEKTLTTQFLKAGYNVYGAGKIYHSSVHREGEWTEYFARSDGERNLRRHPSAKDDGVGGIRFAPLEGDEADMPDYRVVNYGLDKLRSRHDRPFFLAIGLVKPHMPWNVPKKYYDLFPLEQIRLPPHCENDLADVPPAGVRMARPEGDHAAMLRSGRWTEAVQAYLATIAFCDAMVGRLIEGLEQSPYRDNTVVVLWGDHGWHLGEKEHWRKFALWEEAARAPFIWVAPGVTRPGGVCDRPVDFMTLYPTLCELAGVPVPAHVEGPSLVRLLRDPAAPWDRPALTTYHRNNHSFRNEKWRYIRYADGGEELYDHDADPYEWTNLAKDPAYEPIKAGFAGFIPKENAPELPRGGGRARDAGGSGAAGRQRGLSRPAR
ncbi:MAG: iduronate-2-sulfatase [Phycisphaerae bacterium]